MRPINPGLASLLVFGAACAISIAALAAPPAFERAAARTGVPAAVLYSIARTESGMRVDDYGFHPWPWTLNVEGTPERFATKAEAVRRLEALLSEGVTAVDVGLMQIHWRRHRQRFASPADALDIERNLEVGARILRELWTARNDLWRAIGEYHAGTGTGETIQQRADGYRARVAESLVQRLGHDVAD
jgi:soluble lytic murein transglycosylase-like protein